jgi:4-hydroxy-3-methylbut-2-enyl diphosphate reductase
MKRKLEVKLSPHTGYCYGVKRAMRLIEKGLSEHGGTIYTLGDVIHNPQAVEKLKSRGVKPVSSLDEIGEGDTIVIRAHGVDPLVMVEAGRRGIKVIDATCPFVQRSQNYVRRLGKESFQVIIIGDGGHPEVKGISGHAGGKVVTVNTPREAESAGPYEKAGVVIQTTFPRDKAVRIIDVLRSRVTDLRIYDTICKATLLRREAAEELAASVDLMIVVGGRGSSNTKRLYQMCLDKGIAAEFIETAEEIDESWFSQCRTVGLTTGTSTPEWIIDEVLARLDAISRDCRD